MGQSDGLRQEQGNRAPVRYFDYPLRTDPWFLFGLALLVTTTGLSLWLLASNGLLGVTISLIDEFTGAELADLGREVLTVLLVIFLIAWVLPPTARLVRRRQRLRDQEPVDMSQGYFPDPVYPDCDRFWTGAQWSEFVRPKRTIRWARNISFVTIGAIAFSTFQFVGNQSAIQGLRVWSAYVQSVNVYVDYIENLPEDVEAQPWDQYATMLTNVDQEFSNAAQDLSSAVDAFPFNELDGVPASTLSEYSGSYTRWSSTLNELVEGFKQCPLSDEQCLIDVYDPLADRFASNWDALVIEMENISDSMVSEV